jgi:acyl-CoA synthetase (NDP forming)
MPGSNPTERAIERDALSQAIFSPRAIALIGASSDPARLVSRPERLLRRHGYRGAIVRIAPADGADGGTHRSLAEAAVAVDHAFIMVPAMSASAAIAQCAAASVKVATIFSSGFAELGAAGKRRQAALVAAARVGGMRLIGPNSLGVVDVHGRMTLSANAVFEQEELRPGPLGVISQSGSMLGAIVSRGHERGLGFSRLVSVGNECDLAVGELVQLLVDDPETQAILLFLEALRDAAALARAARNAFQAGKPIIAFKVGRSAAGREAAATHTGVIAGSDAAADAFFRAHGILRVTVFEALLETAQLVLGHRPPKRRRVAAVTVSGGAAAMVVDRLGIAGIEVVPPPAEVTARLASQHIRAGAAAVIDLPMGRADGGAYATVLNALLASEHCDVVLAVQGSNAAHMPESIHERVLAATRGAKPLAVFAAPRANEALALLQRQAVAAFRTPEACADAIRAYCDWHAPAALAHTDEALAASVRDAIAAAGPGPLDAHGASKLLAALGIPCARSVVLRTRDQPLDLPFPVAAKILSVDIPHKTEAQAVELDIPDRAALGKRVDAMLARCRSLLPQARIDGVWVQSMQHGIGEALIGFRHDPDVGPVVVLGAGGILTELGSGHAVRLAPISKETALEMIASVPALAALRGYRNRPSGNLEALADALERLSLLALSTSPTVLEAEVNPLIVREDGVIAVDARIRFASA